MHRIVKFLAVFIFIGFIFPIPLVSAEEATIEYVSASNSWEYTNNYDVTIADYYNYDSDDLDETKYYVGDDYGGEIYYITVTVKNIDCETEYDHASRWGKNLAVRAYLVDNNGNTLQFVGSSPRIFLEPNQTATTTFVVESLPTSSELPDNPATLTLHLELTYKDIGDDHVVIDTYDTQVQLKASMPPSELLCYVAGVIVLVIIILILVLKAKKRPVKIRMPKKATPPEDST